MASDQGDDPSIARLAAASMGVGRTLWRHQGDWDTIQLTAFARNDWPLSLGVARHAAHRSPRRRAMNPSWHRLGRWVLEIQDQGLAAAAEAQILRGAFDSLLLLTWPLSGGAATSSEALSYLVSGLFLVTEPDRLRLALLGGQAVGFPAPGALVQTWGAGQLNTLMTPCAGRSPGTNGLAALTAIDLEAQAWWQSDPGAAGRRHLAYLEKRRHRIIKEQATKAGSQCSEPPRPSVSRILSRLSRWS